MVDDGEATASPQPRAISVAFVLPSLGPGGAERVGASLVNYWAKQGWRVSLILFSDPGEQPYYALDDRVLVRRLGIEKPSGHLAAAIWNNLWRLSALRFAIRETRAEVVVSFLETANVLTLLATRGLGLPVVVSMHNDPLEEDIGRVWSWLRRWTYPHAFRVVVLTERTSACLPEPIRRVAQVIPNQVEPLPLSRRRRHAEGLVLTAVGRLVPQKGFDLLLPAFASVAPKHPQWSLVIWGEGPERKRLERLRDELDLTARVRLPGLSTCHGQWVQQADMFVLSSRYEGFPVALGEAMAAGLPVVAADCRTGPREMISDRVNGLLVPSGNAVALAQSLDELMIDETLRHRLGEAARAAAREFSPERIVARWSTLVSQAAARPSCWSSGRLTKPSSSPP